MEKNILIVGVGGQGTLFASVLMGDLAMQNGYDVKLSEVHGMAQRGGSVVTHVRMSDEKVCSPIIDKGGADVIVSFELLEAYRYMPFLKQGGEVYANTQRILPMPVIIGAADYPADVKGYVEQNAAKSVFIDALSIAEKLGNVKIANVIMLGALANSLDFPKEQWFAAIERCAKPRFVELNKTAFEAGYDAVNA